MRVLVLLMAVEAVYHSLAACACLDLQSTLHFLTNKLPRPTVYRCRSLTETMCACSWANMLLEGPAALPVFRERGLWLHILR